MLQIQGKAVVLGGCLSINGLVMLCILKIPLNGPVYLLIVFTFPLVLVSLFHSYNHVTILNINDDVTAS